MITAQDFDDFWINYRYVEVLGPWHEGQMFMKLLPSRLQRFLWPVEVGVFCEVSFLLLVLYVRGKFFQRVLFVWVNCTIEGACKRVNGDRLAVEEVRKYFHIFYRDVQEKKSEKSTWLDFVNIMIPDIIWLGCNAVLMKEHSSNECFMKFLSQTFLLKNCKGFWNVIHCSKRSRKFHLLF